VQPLPRQHHINPSGTIHTLLPRLFPINRHRDSNNRYRLPRPGREFKGAGKMHHPTHRP